MSNPGVLHVPQPKNNVLPRTSFKSSSNPHDPRGLFYHQVKTDLRLPQSNPVQVLLCVIVLLDAGIVIAQILLDLNNVKGNHLRISFCLAQVIRFSKIPLGFINTQPIIII